MSRLVLYGHVFLQWLYNHVVMEVQFIAAKKKS